MDVLSHSVLDEVQAEEIQHVYTTDPVVRMARNFLIKSLFSEPLQVSSKKAKDGVNLDKAFEDYFKNEWERFRIDAFDHLLQYGLFVYVWISKTDKKTKRNFKYPFVVPIHLYTIDIVINDKYEKIYSVSDRKNSRLNQTLGVLADGDIKKNKKTSFVHNTRV